MYLTVTSNGGNVVTLVSIWMGCLKTNEYIYNDETGVLVETMHADKREEKPRTIKKIR